jgi:hypothetical protein
MQRVKKKITEDAIEGGKNGLVIFLSIISEGKLDRGQFAKKFR